MKKPTRGPQATKEIFGDIVDELKDLAEEDESIWEEIDVLKKGTRQTFRVLKDGRIYYYRWRAEYVGLVPDPE